MEHPFDPDSPLAATEREQGNVFEQQRRSSSVVNWGTRKEGRRLRRNAKSRGVKTLSGCRVAWVPDGDGFRFYGHVMGLYMLDDSSRLGDLTG